MSDFLASSCLVPFQPIPPTSTRMISLKHKSDYNTLLKTFNDFPCVLTINPNSLWASKDLGKLICLTNSASALVKPQVHPKRSSFGSLNVAWCLMDVCRCSSFFRYLLSSLPSVPSCPLELPVHHI